MACFVYVLASGEGGSGRTYVGWTNDLDTRLSRHNTGKGAKSTRGRLWRLIYVERHRTKKGAMRREYKLKHDRHFRKTLRTDALSL